MCSAKVYTAADAYLSSSEKSITAQSEDVYAVKAET